MAELLKGRISDTEGLKEVLELIATFNQVSNAVLEIESADASGQIGVAWGRFITGATLKDSDMIGKKALRKMLRLRQGKFRFVDLELDTIDELRQSLGVDLNRVATVVPELDYKEAHFLFEFGESPDADNEPAPEATVTEVTTEEVPVLDLELTAEPVDETPEPEPVEETIFDEPIAEPEGADTQPKLEIEQPELPEVSASELMQSMERELAQDFVLPVSSEPEPLDLVFGGPLPEEFALKELPLPEPDPEGQGPTSGRSMPFLRMQQASLDEEKEKTKRGTRKPQENLPPPPEHVSGTKQALTPAGPLPTAGPLKAAGSLKTAGAPLLQPGVLAAKHSVPSESPQSLRPKPAAPGVPFAVVMLICVIIFVVSCASTVMFGPKAWSGITSVLHLNR